MSKKLIAVAAAAALALTGLVAAPANATISVSYADAAGSVSPQATAASATALIDVPANNKLEFTTTTDRSSLMKATVTTTSGQVVTVTTTGKVRVVEEPTDTTNKYTSASGVTSWSKTATSSSVVFYVYTTGTDAGSVKTTVGGNSTEVFLKGNAGPAYKLSVTLPASVGTVAPSSNNVFASVVDVFGNNVEDHNIDESATSGATLTALTWDSTDKRYEAKLHNATAGPFAVVAELAAEPDEITALGAPVWTFFGTVNAVDASAQVVTLTAQVAALTAQLAESRPKATSVTKKKYNTLARKWNAAFPSQRVALKK